MAAASDQSSSASEENTINNTMAILTREKAIEKPQPTNSETSTFKLFEKVYVPGSKLQQHDFNNHTKNMEMGSSSSSLANSKSNKEDNIKKMSLTNFSCKFCKHQFSSKQALGGHQNAHKSERAFTKYVEEINNNFKTLHHPLPYYNHYSSVAATHYNRPLGINMQSMIHKPRPSYSWISPSYNFCPASSTRTPMQEMETISFLDGLRNETLHVNNGSRVTPKLRNFLKNLEVGLGESSISNGTKSNSMEDHSIVVDTNLEEASNAESVELDLTLKL